MKKCQKIKKWKMFQKKLFSKKTRKNNGREPSLLSAIAGGGERYGILRHEGCHEACSGMLNNATILLVMNPTKQSTGSRFNTHGRCWANSKLEQRRLDSRTQSFYRQTQNGVLWGPKRNDYLHSCSTRSQSWGRNQSKPVFFETDTVELEGTHVPHGQLFQP